MTEGLCDENVNNSNKTEEMKKPPQLSTQQKPNKTRIANALLAKVRTRHGNIPEDGDKLIRLIEMEEHAQRKETLSHAFPVTAITWYISNISGRRMCSFRFTKDVVGLKLRMGQDLRIWNDRYDALTNRFTEAPLPENKRWLVVGKIIDITQDSWVKLQLKSEGDSLGPWDIPEGFTIGYEWNSVPFDRMKEAIAKFARNATCISMFVGRFLTDGAPIEIDTGIDSAEKLNVPGWRELNASQSTAIRVALSRSVSVIQGPAGSGKTLTSATLVYHLSKRTRRDQILVCAPSNVACDHLTEKIAQANVSIVRVLALCRQDGRLSHSIEPFCLHIIVKEKAKEPGNEELLQLIDRLERNKELSRNDMRRYHQLRIAIEQRILDSADVICCTCVTAGNIKLKDRQFACAVIDEAAQCSEAMCMIPIAAGCRQVVFVGDHKQLSPTVLSQEALVMGFNVSLYERLIEQGCKPLLLNKQYRMHPAISKFPSAQFYGGALLDGVTAADRTIEGFEFPWPKPDKPLVFCHSATHEITGPHGRSLSNSSSSPNF